VGLPFCVFKLLTGLIVVGMPSVRGLGYALLALGTIDAVLNLGNLAALVTLHRRVSGVCLAAIALRKHPDLALAIDVFVSFGLVAVVIGGGLFGRIPGWAQPIWNLAVVLNVLGAGIGRLLSALRKPAT